MSASAESQLEVRLQADLEEVEDRVLVEETALLLAQMQALIARGGLTRGEVQLLLDGQQRLGLAIAETLDPPLRDHWSARLREDFLA